METEAAMNASIAIAESDDTIWGEGNREGGGELSNFIAHEL